MARQEECRASALARGDCKASWTSGHGEVCSNSNCDERLMDLPSTLSIDPDTVMTRRRTHSSLHYNNSCCGIAGRDIDGGRANGSGHVEWGRPRGHLGIHGERERDAPRESVEARDRQG